MEYITTKEASAKWGISTTRITILANQGRIPEARRLGRSWLIPANATKPQVLKPDHSGSHKKEIKNSAAFSFPLYHFRPDWNYIKEAPLSDQQQQLLLAETAVLECRFADAYPLLESILQNPEDITTEMGGLLNAGICCIGLNKPNDFFKFYIRLQLLLSKATSHRKDLTFILDALNTYIDTFDSAAKNDVYYATIHEQCLPIACVLTGYKHLSQEIIEPGSTDTNLLELNLCFLKNTSAFITVEMMHCYLLGIYDIRQNSAAAEKHARDIVQIAYETSLYFPLVSFYQYLAPILSPILAQYPEDFQNHINKLSSEYEENYTIFTISMNNDSIVSNITSDDMPLIYAVLINLPNSIIADKLSISPRTVARRLETLCKKLGVSSKRDLRTILHKYI